MWLALERLDLLVTSSIGRFGWLDTTSPYGVIVAWLAALGAVVLLGICLARRRGVVTIAGNLMAWLAIPTVIAISGARQDGILGQGRDYMALAVGIPIVATFLVGERIGDRRTTLRLSTMIVVLLAACQVADFYGALRRNVVGSAGPSNLLTPVVGGWRPPIPPIVLIIAFTLAMVAFAIILCAAAGAQAGQVAEPALAVTMRPAHLHRPRQRPEPGPPQPALEPTPNQSQADRPQSDEAQPDQAPPDQPEPAPAQPGPSPSASLATAKDVPQPA